MMLSLQGNSQRQHGAATRRGEELLRSEPRAAAVRYDRRIRKVVIELDNGCTLLVPPELAQGLSTASPAELSQAKVLGPGTAIS